MAGTDPDPTAFFAGHQKVSVLGLSRPFRVEMRITVTGRPEARFDRLYSQHQPSILAYCLRRAPRDRAHEAANQVFAVAWRRLDEMPEGEMALAWLYGVARRTLSQQRRSADRFARLRRKATAMATRVQHGPETAVMRRLEDETVRRAVADLKPDDQEMLLLSAWEGLTHREISEATGLSLAAVDKRLARAKQRLKRSYEAVSLKESGRGRRWGT
jgi:RNA polymerase sigma-70 factor (ECF subfamily)